MPPNALAPSAVSFAGASETTARPPFSLRPEASKVTSGTFFCASPAPPPPPFPTSAASVPLPPLTVTTTRLSARSRFLPVKRSVPAKAASRVADAASYVPRPSGKRKSAPPSWAPSATFQEPWAREPVTYSRKVRRTPQSTAAPVNSPSGRSSPAGEPEGLGLASGDAFASATTSAERLTRSRAAPSA